MREFVLSPEVVFGALVLGGVGALACYYPF